jgi:hypothetical protein
VLDLYVRAPELGSFSFRQRAWFLERKGVGSTLQIARKIGPADHQQHREAAAYAMSAARAPSVLLIVGVIAFAAEIAFDDRYEPNSSTS